MSKHESTIINTRVQLKEIINLTLNETEKYLDSIRNINAKTNNDIKNIHKIKYYTFASQLVNYLEKAEKTAVDIATIVEVADIEDNTLEIEKANAVFECFITFRRISEDYLEQTEKLLNSKKLPFSSFEMLNNGNKLMQKLRYLSI